MQQQPRIVEMPAHLVRGSPKLRFEAESGTSGFCFRILPVPHVRSSSSPLANRFVRTIAKPALSGKKELPHPPPFLLECFRLFFLKITHHASRIHFSISSAHEVPAPVTSPGSISSLREVPGGSRQGGGGKNPAEKTATAQKCPYASRITHHPSRLRRLRGLFRRRWRTGRAAAWRECSQPERRPDRLVQAVA